jgi:hypothetical protein
MLPSATNTHVSEHTIALWLIHNYERLVQPGSVTRQYLSHASTLSQHILSSSHHTVHCTLFALAAILTVVGVCSDMCQQQARVSIITHSTRGTLLSTVFAAPISSAHITSSAHRPCTEVYTAMCVDCHAGTTLIAISSVSRHTHERQPLPSTYRRW